MFFAIVDAGFLGVLVCGGDHVVVERLYYWHMDLRSVGSWMMVFMMRGSHGGRSNYALDILKERFARGEITKAEYEERRRVLGV